MRQSLEELIELHQKSLYAAAFSVCRNIDDANDAVQDTFIQYYTSKKQFHDGEHLKAWLLRVAANCANDWFRAPWRRREGPLTDSLPAPEHEDGGVVEAVLALPAKYRTAVPLYYYEELSVAETAKTLGVAQGTVKSRLSRARERLRELLNEEES